MATSFSSTVKEELARFFPERECCRRAELAALVQMAGRLAPEGLRLRCNSPAVARKAFRYWKELFGLLPEVVPGTKRASTRGHHYVLSLPDGPGLREALARLALRPAPGERLAWRPGRTPRACCGRSYLRGIFLGGGSVSRPEGAYHLELLLRDEGQERLACRLLAHFGLQPHLASRHGKRLVYLKESEQIADLLKIMGAHGALLSFENTRIVKEMRNEVNRLVNAETANVQKTVNAAVRQAEAIEFLRETVGLDNLPPSLAQVARLRLEMPDASLRELGEMLTPPLGKSGVNHRLRRLEDLAGDVRAGLARREEEGRAQGRALSGPGS